MSYYLLNYGQSQSSQLRGLNYSQVRVVAASGTVFPYYTPSTASGTKSFIHSVDMYGAITNTAHFLVFEIAKLNAAGSPQIHSRHYLSYNQPAAHLDMYNAPIVLLHNESIRITGTFAPAAVGSGYINMHSLPFTPGQ